jgi:hypothetical protein
MKKSAILLSLCFAIGTQSVLADETPAPPASGSPRQGMSELRSACAADAQKLCPGVQPGGGRILQCLKEHKDEVSEGCKQAVLKAQQSPAQ